MKKIKKTLLLFLFAFIVMPTGTIFADENDNVQANNEEYLESIEQDVDKMFEPYDSSKKILQLSDGGFIQGWVEEYDADSGELTRIYDSEIDKSAITIEEAKDIVKAQRIAIESGWEISTYGTTIPTQTKRLILNAKPYTSNFFSGKGWRIGGYKFLPQSGTGQWLLWTSYNDSGNAGTADHCRTATTTGQASGRALDEGRPTYVGYTDWMMYYTYNPVPGSYYTVQNI